MRLEPVDQDTSRIVLGQDKVTEQKIPLVGCQCSEGVCCCGAYERLQGVYRKTFEACDDVEYVVQYLNLDRVELLEFWPWIEGVALEKINELDVQDQVYRCALRKEISDLQQPPGPARNKSRQND
jgi:hypothetical protein